MTDTPAHLGGHGNMTHIDEGALEYLCGEFEPVAFLDVGCGPGGMVDLAKARDLEALGIDGDPNVARAEVVEYDFVVGRHLGLEAWAATQFPLLVWTVEFLEHLYEEHLNHAMCLIRTGAVALVTAAPPERGGHHHVNCQPEAYWLRVFGEWGMGFSALHTAAVREASTMARDFVREGGLVFIGGTDE